MLTRRGFLKGCIALAVVAVAPITAIYNRAKYKLFGDGITDDTDAIQALIDGKPVEMPDGSIQVSRAGRPIYLPRGEYRIGDTLGGDDVD